MRFYAVQIIDRCSSEQKLCKFICGSRTDFNTDIGAREMLRGLYAVTDGVQRSSTIHSGWRRDSGWRHDRDRSTEQYWRIIIAYFLGLSFVVCYRWHFRTDWCRFR